MSLQVTFPGGLAVAAQIDGFEIMTDQPVEDGGGGTAPSPYDFFLSSIGTCAGYYAMQFCRQREIPTEDMYLTLDIERDLETRKLLKVMIDIVVPPSFPEKYHKAIIRAADQCSVKKALVDPPELMVNAVRG